MLPELTNLLPFERRGTLARDYLLRLGTLALVALGLLLIVHAILLTPTYAYVREQKEVQEQRLTELTEERAVSGFMDLSARIAAFSASAASLEQLRTLPSASESIRAILELPRGGVTLSSFAFSAPSKDGSGRMVVMGMAPTRESLRAFDDALGNLEFVAATDLPLSAYAKESDIPFTITLTLNFTKP